MQNAATKKYVLFYVLSNSKTITHAYRVLISYYP